jgi:hypothetical protein
VEAVQIWDQHMQKICVFTWISSEYFAQSICLHLVSRKTRNKDYKDYKDYKVSIFNYNRNCQDNENIVCRKIWKENVQNKKLNVWAILFRFFDVSGNIYYYLYK